VLLHVIVSVVSCNIISNQDSSSFIRAHIDPFVPPYRPIGDRLNGAAGHDAQLTEVQKLAFSDYTLASADHFDYFEYAWLLCEWLKP
jgi:hypothetical protein